MQRGDVLPLLLTATGRNRAICVVVWLLANVVHLMHPLGHLFQHLPTRPRLVDLVLQIKNHTMSHPVVVIVALRVQKLLARSTVPRRFAVRCWRSVVQLVVGTFTNWSYQLFPSHTAGSGRTPGELVNQAGLQEFFWLLFSCCLHVPVIRQMPLHALLETDLALCPF